MAVASGALVLSGCLDGVTTRTDMVFDPPDDGGGPPLATFALVQQQVLGPSCALSGCHADAAYPNLSPANAYANLVNAASSAAFPEVTPGDPAASYLLVKLTGGPGMFGSRMPADGAPLDSTRIDLVRRWIARGAPND
jgi:hypothetical protein